MTDFEKFATKYYYIFPIFSGVCFGTHNFIMELAFIETMELRSILPEWVGLVFYFCCYHSVTTYQHYKSTGEIFTKKGSPYFKDDGTFNYFNAMGICIRASLQFI